jgi:uncharacterized membrane protein
MKFTIKIFLTALAAYFVANYFPWWSVAIVAFIISAIIQEKNISSFFNGFLSIGFLWLGMAIFSHQQSDGILTDKIGQLLSLPDSALLFVAVFLVGGLVGGMAGLLGSQFYYLLRTKKRKY